MSPINETPERKPRYKYIKTFRPLPWQVEPWRDTSKVLLLTGAAGGGKSRLAAEKLHAFCLKYPGSTALVLRKVRATIENSALLLLKREVIGNDPRVTHLSSKFRFEYNNGSVLAYGGMKDDEQRERIRSIGQKGGVDIAWFEEATEFTEQDFSELGARMRGSSAPWRQVILTTNPDAPGHWINIRLILGGGASVYRSRASDNFHNPADYQEWLETLTGTEYRRLVLGEWCEGEGRIFDTYQDDYNAKTGSDHRGNVTLKAEYIPDGGQIIWAVDDGYSGKMDDKTRMFTGKSHPRAFLFCQLRGDGTLAVYGEDFKIQTLAGEHIDRVVNINKKNGWPEPDYVVHDRAAASLSGALGQAGYDVVFDRVPVDESIKEMREWLAADRNGVRRILIHPRCFYLRYQMQTYSYDNSGNVIKEHDDGPDALRYLVWNLGYGLLGGGVDIATYEDV